MKLLKHFSAKASHYNKNAKHYDQFNQENSKVINQTIENILKEHKIKTILDLTCGTGSQVFWLTKHGYKVIGADISTMMLKVAKNKAKKENLDIKFLEGDMRNFYVGKFDAVITIFNSVGHLTKLDFEKAMRNINSNLKPGGIYIFDINNLDYLLEGNNITMLTIDWQKITADTKVRDVQYSTITSDGILASYTTSFEQRDSEKPKIFTQEQTLQVYKAKQLKDMLERNGFSVIEQLAIDGSKFIETETTRILMVTKKN